MISCSSFCWVFSRSHRRADVPTWRADVQPFFPGLVSCVASRSTHTRVEADDDDHHVIIEDENDFVLLAHDTVLIYSIYLRYNKPSYGIKYINYKE